jgi:hypothetical protein
MKLIGDQARIVNIHLQRQPERVMEFVNANLVLEQLQSFWTGSQTAGTAGGVLLGLVVGGSLGGALSAIIGGLTRDKGAAIVEDCAMDCLDAPSHRWSSGRLSKYRKDPDKDSIELST